MVELEISSQTSTQLRQDLEIILVTVLAKQGKHTRKSHLIEEDLRVASTTPTRRREQQLQEVIGKFITVKSTTGSRPISRHHKSNSRMTSFVRSQCHTRLPIG